MEIGSTSLLSDLTGLGSLRFVRYGLLIYDNNLLTSLTGLDNLDSIGGTLGIYDNDSLTSLTGLENLNTIAGDLFLGIQLDWFIWYGNPVLSDISALENIEAGSLEVMQIVYNPSLAECAITSICEYLAGPGTAVSFYENAPGCNSQEEVEAACGVGVETPLVQSSKFKVQSYPNPTAGIVDLQFTVYNLQSISLKVYNAQGQEVAVVVDQKLPAGEHTVRWDATALPAGIYFYRLSTVNCQLPTCGKIVMY